MVRILPRRFVAGPLAFFLVFQPLATVAAAPAGPAPKSAAVKPNRTAPKVAAPATSLTFSSLPSDDEIANAHVLAGAVTPLADPVSRTAALRENRALAQAFMAYTRQGQAEDTRPLVRFLQEHPRSRYEASLLTNLGALYREQGRVSHAYPALMQAWSLTRRRADPKGRAVADWALAEMFEMYAHLDRERRDGLNAVMDETAGRDIHGPATMKLEVARQQRAQLAEHPAEAFRCGPVSLALLREYLHMPRDPAIENAKASDEGFSLAALQDLANSHGMRMRPVRSQPDAPVPVPSIVHWKYDHYSAILERKVERGHEYFRLENPLLDNGKWLSREALEEEASGYYLVLDGSLEAGWNPVGKMEAGAVWGRCLFTALDLTQFMEWAVKVIQGFASCGMPQYDFHAALVSLNISDTPLAYSPPIGPPVRFKITYNQKDSYQPSVFTYSNLGPKWTFDWMSYVDLTHPGAVYLRGGGVEQNNRVYASVPAAYTIDPQSHAQLVQTSDRYPMTFERRLPDGSKEIFTLNTSNFRQVFLTQIIDPQGNAVNFTYDPKYRLVAVTDAIGQVTTLSYEMASDPLKITKVTDPFGRTAVMTYDNGGHLTQITDMIGMTSSFRYGTNDFIQALNTPYGTTLFTTGHGPDTTDSLNTYIQASDALGTQRVEYRNQLNSLPLHDAWENQLNANFPPVPDLNTRLTFYWDRYAAQRGTSDYTVARVYQWMHSNGPGSSSGILAYTKNPLEGRVVYSYPGQTKTPYFYTGTSAVPNSVLRLLEDGKTQQTTLIESNDLGNITKFTDPMNRQTLYFYDSNEIDRLQTINAGTFETLENITYNSQHLPTSYTDAAGQTTTFTYNTAGQILSVTDAKGNTTGFAYDPNGYLVSIAGPLQAVTSFTYDTYGRLQTVTDVDGYTRTYQYDALDRVTSITYPDQTSDQITYDKLNPVVFTDRLGRTTRVSYDMLRRPVSVTDPMGQTTTFGWCGCGALASMTDPKGNTTGWLRDVQGRVNSKIYADGSAIQYQYDPMTGRLLKVTDAKGQIRNYSYFADGTVRQVTYSGGQATPPVTFTYDATVNRMTSFTDGIGTTSYTYVPAGVTGAYQVAGVTGPRGVQINYAYDELGRVVGRTINGVPMALGYDALGRVVGESNALGSFTHSYAGASGRLQSITYPSGQSTQYSYFDPTGDLRVQTILHQDPNQNMLSQFDYTYAATGEIATVTRQAPELKATPSTYQFTYSPATQLNAAGLTIADGSTVTSFGYKYDASDNRTMEQINATQAPLAFNNLNQVSSFKYDKNGNLTADSTRTYEWDAADRLTAVVSGTHRSEFTYDGLGRWVRVTEKTNNVVTGDRQLVWCKDTICEERSISGNSSTVTRRFFAQGETEVVNGMETPYYYTRDRLGTVRQLIDANGALVTSYEYDPWGRPSKLTGGKDPAFGFAGYYWHQTSGLNLTEHRAYDPATGRWLNRDPLGESGGLNLYAYVDNNTPNGIDPSGLGWWKMWKIYSKATQKLVKQVYIRGEENAIKEIKLALEKAGTGAIITAKNEKAAKELAEKLSTNGKARLDPAAHGYPAHYNPEEGPYSHVHIQVEAPTFNPMVFLAPESLRASENPNHTTDESIASGAWDLAGWLDPFFVTDAIEFFVGTDWLHPSCPAATPGTINWMSPGAAASPLFQ